MAWAQAVRELGFETEIVPLRTREVAEDGGGVGLVGRLKKALIPMPLDKRIPAIVGTSDLVVATVPAVFRSALRSYSSGPMIFDWMDLWSVSSRTIGDARWSSSLGGRAQGRLWKFREAAYPSRVGANTVAGYSEYESMARSSSRPVRWLPNPVAYRRLTRQERTTGPNRLGFIGNFNYGPNTLSLRNFLSNNSGLLGDPACEIVVAGFGSEIARTWDFPITVLGPVDNLDDFYSRIDAAVVPITHGSGIKIKALEALAHGVPVFGTQHVRDGLPPAIRDYVLDIAMVGERQLELERPSGEAFDAIFGFEAFKRTVSDTIADARTNWLGK